MNRFGDAGSGLGDAARLISSRRVTATEEPVSARTAKRLLSLIFAGIGSAKPDSMKSSHTPGVLGDQSFLYIPPGQPASHQEIASRAVFVRGHDALGPPRKVIKASCLAAG